MECRRHWVSVAVTAALSGLALGCCTSELAVQEMHLLPCSSPFPLGLLFLAAESTLTNSPFLLHFLLLRQVEARTKQLHSGESSTAHSLPTGWGQGLGGLAVHCITTLPSRARERARTVFKTPGSGEEWFGWGVLWGPHKERSFLTVRTPCGPPTMALPNPAWLLCPRDNASSHLPAAVGRWGRKAGG